MADEKLILDQPDTVTESGKIEHVVPKKPLNEQEDEKKEVLLTEQLPSINDGFVIM